MGGIPHPGLPVFLFFLPFFDKTFFPSAPWRRSNFPGGGAVVPSHTVLGLGRAARPLQKYASNNCCLQASSGRERAQHYLIKGWVGNKVGVPCPGKSFFLPSTHFDLPPHHSKRRGSGFSYVRNVPDRQPQRHAVLIAIDRCAQRYAASCPTSLHFIYILPWPRKCDGLESHTENSKQSHKHIFMPLLMFPQIINPVSFLCLTLS